MWEAEVVKNVVIEGQLTVGVVYTRIDKGEVVEQFRENIVSKDGQVDVMAVITKRIKDLGELKESKDKVALGKVTTTPEVPPTPHEPTAEELKRNEYNNKLSELGKKKYLVDLGVIDDKDLVNLKKEVKDLAVELGEV